MLFSPFIKLTCPFLDIAMIPSVSLLKAVAKITSVQIFMLQRVVQLSKSHKCKIPYFVTM